MENKIKDAFSALETPVELKRAVRARLHRRLRWLPACKRLTILAAAAAASCALWFHPVTRIGLDVNPSLELQVNAFRRVIALVGLNQDGEALAAALDVHGRPYDEAMSRIMVSDQLMGYLKQGHLLSITVAGNDAPQVLEQVVCRAYAAADDDQIFYILADERTAKAAQKAGMSLIRYEAWQAAMTKNPAVTAQEIQEMSMTQIRGLLPFEKLEDPCH